MNVRERLFALRMKLMFSRREMADGIEVNVATIYRYESGLRSPTIQIARRIVNLAKKHGIEISITEITNTL